MRALGGGEWEMMREKWGMVLCEAAVSLLKTTIGLYCSILVIRTLHIRILFIMMSGHDQ
jgi:hypothetical protein